MQPTCKRNQIALAFPVQEGVDVRAVAGNAYSGVQMRSSILALALILGCKATPTANPTAAPETPATPSEPQLGRTAEADPPEPERADPPSVEPQVTSMPPRPEFANAEAPPRYQVLVTTTVGDFVIVVDRDLAPNSAKRFYNLARLGYYRDVTFFRSIPNFMVQFGIHGDPEINAAWKGHSISSDPVKASNLRGSISFAKAGPDTETTQLFINLGDNPRLDNLGFAPFGQVVDGIEVIDRIYDGYGEGEPRGRGPSQARITTEGETYLQQFPELTRIIDMQLI